MARTIRNRSGTLRYNKRYTKRFRKYARKSAGQSFLLKRKIPTEESRAVLTYFFNISPTNGQASRYAFGPDGIWDYNAGANRFRTWDAVGTAKFNAFAGLYDLYMVTFVKLEFVPMKWEITAVAGTVSSTVQIPPTSAHLSAATDWNLNVGTNSELANQDKFWITRPYEPFIRTINMAYHAQNTSPIPFLPVASYLTGGYSSVAGTATAS